jgi:hypothetical protein
MDQIDPTIKALASAILTKESNGNYQAKGASGEYGAYQFMPNTWKSMATAVLGNANAPMTVENQNRVAYSQIKSWKDQGLSPAQIASKWNSGNPDAYKQNHVGTNAMGVHYDTPKYAMDVSNLYRQKLQDMGVQTAQAQELNPTTPTNPKMQQPETQESATKYKPIFPAADVGTETSLSAAAKTVGNIPSSAWNFVKGLANLINPIEIGKNIQGTIQGIPELVKESGGVKQAFGNIISTFPKSAYETAIPEAARGVIKAIGGAFGGNQSKVDTGLQMAQQSVINDPVGQIAPFLMAGKAVADRAGIGEGFDKAITKTSDIVTKPIAKAIDMTSEGAGKATNFGVSQATGLNPETIRTIVDNPEDFSREAQASIDRLALGKEIKNALAARSSELSDTGKLYEPIRASETPIGLNTETSTSSNFLNKLIEDNTGTKIVDDKITTSGAANIRNATEVRALQSFYDTWKPTFDSGRMTTNEFLNFRTDLADMSRFERQIGKSQPLENAAKAMRRTFNATYRDQIPGLGDTVDANGQLIKKGLDSQFKIQKEQYRRLSKNIVDKNGNLTDAAINRIANAAGKGKDLLLQRLEETMPGITQRIKILKAVEDIKHASGIKVGTYTRAAIVGGEYFMGGPLSAVVAAILTSPEMAVPILAKFGLLKNSAAIQAIIQALKNGATKANQLPEKVTLPLQNKEIIQKTLLGKSIEEGLNKSTLGK